MVCWKFLSLYSSTKIFEIGKHLTKLSPKFGTTVFFGDTVYKQLFPRQRPTKLTVKSRLGKYVTCVRDILFTNRQQFYVNRLTAHYSILQRN